MNTSSSSESIQEQSKKHRADSMIHKTKDVLLSTAYTVIAVSMAALLAQAAWKDFTGGAKNEAPSSEK